MFKKVVAALLAAAAFAPAAMAQDTEGGKGDPRRMERQHMRDGGGDEGGRPRFVRDGGDAPRPQPQRREQPPAPAARPQPQPDQPRASFQGRGEQGRPDWRGNPDRGPRGDAGAGRRQAGGWNGQRPDDGRVRDNAYPLPDPNRRWDTRGQARPAPFTDRGRPDAGRRFDDRRWDGNRPDARNPGWNGRNDWSRGWRDDRRYDWGRYRTQNRGIFHLPRYYAPPRWSYGYRRFSIGATLSSLLWSQNYWIDDPWYYRLPPAYGPYRWVRYYDDALLIDVRTGYVVDTVYDIFW